MLPTKAETWAVVCAYHQSGCCPGVHDLWVRRLLGSVCFVRHTSGGKGYIYVFEDNSMLHYTGVVGVPVRILPGTAMRDEREEWRRA